MYHSDFLMIFRNFSNKSMEQHIFRLLLITEGATLNPNEIFLLRREAYPKVEPLSACCGQTLSYYKHL
jgi:hypothetical protein